MKKILSLLAALLCIGLVLAGCKNNSGSGGGSNLSYDKNERPPAAGWYEMSYSDGTASDYYYIKSDGKIARTGKTQEFFNDELEDIIDACTYGTLKYIASYSDKMTFHTGSAPSWGGKTLTESDVIWTWVTPYRESGQYQASVFVFYSNHRCVSWQENTAYETNDPYGSKIWALDFGPDEYEWRIEGVNLVVTLNAGGTNTYEFFFHLQDSGSLVSGNGVEYTREASLENGDVVGRWAEGSGNDFVVAEFDADGKGRYWLEYEENGKTEQSGICNFDWSLAGTRVFWSIENDVVEKRFMTIADDVLTMESITLTKSQE